MMDIKGDLDNLGVTLVAIGSGSPSQAKNFAETFHFTGELYVDKTLDTFRAFNLERGFLKTLGPASIGRGLKTMGQGFRQGLSAGDLWQQGGVFVVGPGNHILFAHRDMKAGFHAEPQDVVDACRLTDTP